jgi:uridylate kinase
MNSPKTLPKPKYKKVLLKISGEALQGKKGDGISPEELETISQEIVSDKRHGSPGFS